MMMTKKQRKRTQLQKAAESFTNKAEKWSNTDRQQDLDPVSNRMKASKRVRIDWVSKKIFNPQNYEDVNWHTKSKCPQRGLHLVIHNFQWNNGKKGFTFIEDERFYCPESEAFYPLRVELIPRKDKKRQKIGYTVYKNEFGLQKDYEVFYNRHKFKLKTYSTTEQILEVSKSGIWRENPLRNFTKDGIQYPGLRYDLNKHGWKKVTESRSFANIGLTIRAGRKWMNDSKAKNIHFNSNEKGICEISLQQLQYWREKFSKISQERANENQDMNVDASKINS